MIDPEVQARNRYFMMVGVQMLATAGAVFGLVLAGRSTQWETTVLGGAIVLMGLYVIAVVPRAMARRWRTPDDR
ncbi:MULTISPECIES: hypothetical protein [unclassified Sphingosinithalassobacter]|uniref:hypothetical protein n=1 Tax=unclassified Sphingosinithalassobacter TaxID=2676235 RepID=UPI0021D03AE1|nr:hypothetical protein [Sphingosinithalassobacter sp. CS137]